MTPPYNQHLVLVGAGHAHLHIARQADRFHRHGIQLTLVDPGTFWYSGMATGVLGGLYNPADDQVDPQALIEHHGGRFLRDRVVGLNRLDHSVTLESGTSLPYDAVSFNVGSEVAVERTSKIYHHAWTVKPISNLWRLRQHLERYFNEISTNPLDIVVIGGGPTGCEVAANIAGLARRHRTPIRLALCSRSERLLPHQPAGAARRLTRTLSQRGIAIHNACEITQIERAAVITHTGHRLPCTIPVIATGLKPRRIIRELGLTTDTEGGLLVTAELHSVDDSRVFGAGDCISLKGHQLPKIGVFGVRAAPILLHNLLATLTAAPLRPYHPQKRYLTILNLGCGQGLAIWGPWYWQGRLSLWLKDSIDRRFLDQYRLPEPET